MKSNNNSLSQIAEVGLVYRNKIKAADRPVVRTSKEAYKLLLSSWDENRIELVESFKIMLLNRSNACLGISEISTGGANSCIADPKIIFATALKSQACNLILAHNHPSGNVEPSKADMLVSQKIRQGARLLDIQVLDHIIVTPDQYYSFADEGKLIP